MTIPEISAPPSPNVTPIPGILKVVIPLSPKVISLEAVAELASASYPMHMLF